MTAAYYDLCIDQGATFQRQITWKDSNDEPIDMTGYTARMQVRKTIRSEDVLVELTTENGGIEITGADGLIEINIAAADTADFEFSKAVYDLEVESSEGVVTRLLQGYVSVSREVTR